MSTIIFYFFFFSSRRRHTRLQGDWSSDVCSSDLPDRTSGAFTGTSERLATGMPVHIGVGQSQRKMESRHADLGETSVSWRDYDRSGAVDLARNVDRYGSSGLPKKAAGVRRFGSGRSRPASKWVSRGARAPFG